MKVPTSLLSHSTSPADAIAALYPQYQVSYGRNNARFCDYLEVQYSVEGKSFKKVLEVSESLANDERQILLGLKTLLEDFTVSLGTNITGEYPFARLWHDRHINEQKIFGHPEKPVPGWVFPLVDHDKNEYPNDLGKNESNKEPVGVFINDESQLAPLSSTPWVEKAKFVVRENQKKLEQAMEKSTKSKKRVVVKAPIKINPDKVKPPNCNVHGTMMLYSKITEKWECITSGCSQVARPLRDSDSRDLVFGKGDIELRIVQQGNNTTVVLISSDNVALDVTKFVDVEKLIEDSDAVTLAEAAEGASKDSFLIVSEQTIQIKSKVVVIGTSDFLSTHKER